MSKLTAWVEATPQRRRQFAQERLIISVAEEVLRAMDRAGVSKADLANSLGTSKAHITQVLDGARNMTLRTLADIAYSLNASADFAIHDHAHFGQWQPLKDAVLGQYRSPMLLGDFSAQNNDDWHNVALLENARAEVA